MGVANSAALRAAHITRATPDPPGGTIVRDSKGEPTGALKDSAMSPVFAVIPDLTPAQRLRAVKRATAHAASVGVTSVQDMTPDFADVSTYQLLDQRGEMLTRIYAAHVIEAVNELAKVGMRHAFGGPWLRVGAVKAFADGSLGSRTAYFFDAIFR